MESQLLLLQHRLVQTSANNFSDSPSAPISSARPDFTAIISNLDLLCCGMKSFFHNPSNASSLEKILSNLTEYVIEASLHICAALGHPAQERLLFSAAYVISACHPILISKSWKKRKTVTSDCYSHFVKCIHQLLDKVAAFERVLKQGENQAPHRRSDATVVDGSISNICKERCESPEQMEEEEKEKLSSEMLPVQYAQLTQQIKRMSTRENSMELRNISPLVHGIQSSKEYAEKPNMQTHVYVKQQNTHIFYDFDLFQLPTTWKQKWIQVESPNLLLFPVVVVNNGETDVIKKSHKEPLMYFLKEATLKTKIPSKGFGLQIKFMNGKMLTLFFQSRKARDEWNAFLEDTIKCLKSK